MNAGPSTELDYRSDGDSGSSHISRSYRQTEQEEKRNRPISPRDFESLAQLRSVITRNAKGRNWTDYAILVGTLIIGSLIVLTFIITLGINARANRIIDETIIRDSAGEVTAKRVEERLDELVAGLRGFQEAAESTTTTTTGNRSSTGTTVSPRQIPTTTPRTTPPITTLRPITPVTPRPPMTVAPCALALLNRCIL